MRPKSGSKNDPASSKRSTEVAAQRCQFRHSGLVCALRLILQRLLGMIDDENLSGALLRFQFQPKLVFDRLEDRRLALALIRCPLECEIVVVCEPGLIQDGAMQVML